MFKPVKPTEVAPVDIRFDNVSVAGFGENYCVYEVYKDNALIYVGTCKFTQFGQMPDAQANSHFMQTVNRDDTLLVRIIATGSRADCYNYRIRHAKALPDVPECNRQGVFGRFTGVQCIDDGITYRTQSAAAAAYGMSQGNLSSHLRGVPGYGTVQGRTFRRVAL